jgi:starvation-inducible DNA-binding protein
MATTQTQSTQRVTAPDIEIGIDAQGRQALADGLSHLLADTYTLYLKTQNFHWNVTGPMFQALHTMFESQYTELAAAVDEIAERIRALDHPAPGSFSRFEELTTIKEETGVPSAEEMIRQLVLGQEAVVRTARSVYASADSVNDQVTIDLLNERMQRHEKAAWMLRSLLR